MESLELWARNGEAVRQAIELGELVHLETASEELTDEFLLFAIESGLSKTWAAAFPDPRTEPEIGMEVILPAHIAGRFAGLYSLRKTGYVLQIPPGLPSPSFERCEQGCWKLRLVFREAPRLYQSEVAGDEKHHNNNTDDVKNTGHVSCSFSFARSESHTPTTLKRGRPKGVACLTVECSSLGSQVQ